MSKDCTIQDVFHRFYSSFESTHSISPAQRKAAYHIMNCKTGAFGVNVSVCEDCGCISVHYNSCRDRCCPMCQEFPKEKWVDARREDILDAPYFHVVFTVPEELNPIIYSNQKFLYTALYHAASDTLSELAADSKYLGTDIGYICILHTCLLYTSCLRYTSEHQACRELQRKICNCRFSRNHCKCTSAVRPASI